MEIGFTDTLTLLIVLKERIFHDFLTYTVDLRTLTGSIKATDACSQLLHATAGYYLQQQSRFSQHFLLIDRTALPESEQAFYEALNWIHMFETTDYTEKAAEQFERWLLDAEPELRVLTLCHFLPLLASLPNKFPILKQKLQALMQELENLPLAVSVRGLAIIARFYHEVFDDTDLSLQASILGFHRAQQFNLPNFEFHFLHLIGQAYLANTRFAEALPYFQQALEFALIQAIHPALLAQMYYQLALAHLNHGEPAITQSYYNRLQLLIATHHLPDYFSICAEICQLSCDTLTKTQAFTNVWDRYVVLSERYLALQIPAILFPRLEADFLQLEALIHERYTHDHEQLLYTYFAHLNYYREQTPGKYFAIAQLYKKIAQTYKAMDEFASAWEYYQAYAQTLQTWEKQAVRSEYVPLYADFATHLQQQKLQRIKTSTASLNQMRLLDPLTQLYSRHHLDTVLQQKQQPSGCAVIDLDYFKRFNDTHGHQGGDCALQQVAALIRQVLSPNELAFRYGGEEFLILSFATDKAVFAQQLHILLEKIAALPITLETTNTKVFITASIGAQWQQTPTFHFAHAFQQADLALYQSKENGRNQIQFFSPE